MTATSVPAPLLSRSVLVDSVPDGGLTVRVEATPAEREGLRDLNGLVAIDELTASLVLRRESGGGLRVAGEVIAAVVQTCVVSLEPFEATLREPVAVQFLQPDALDRWRTEHAGEPDDETTADEPDPILAGRVDLGVIVAEHLTLGLDPYPRKPGVQFAAAAAAPSEADASPFAVLKAWRPDDV